MPITKSAKKALRQNIRRRARNLTAKTKLKTEIKKFRGLIIAKKVSEAKAQLPLVFKLLDKAAKTGLLKPNAASRQKSRLSKALARAK
ncbi:MAG: 30S ribosomal protein S20 [Parcubacteria group bacterium]|nr:30S ribosomal protein S20 [Parcubacteria group bacterium]